MEYFPASNSLVQGVKLLMAGYSPQRTPMWFGLKFFWCLHESVHTYCLF